MKASIEEKQVHEQRKPALETSSPRMGTVLLMIGFYILIGTVNTVISAAIEVIRYYPLDTPGFTVYWYDIFLSTLSLLLLLYLCKKSRITFFSADKIPRKHWLLAGYTFAAMYASSMAIGYIGTTYGLFEETLNEEILQQMLATSSTWVWMYDIVLLAPIAEEVVFRGLIMKYLFPRKKVLGYLVASLIFAAVHIPTDFISFLLYFIPGLGLGYVYYKTKRLELAIAVHFLNNLISTLFTI